MLALMIGAIEIGLGVAKLGFVADLLSKEVQVGYMNGLCITIIVGQLPKLFGFSTGAEGFVSQVKAFVTDLDETNRTTLVLGLTTLLVLLVFPRVTTKLVGAGTVVPLLRFLNSLLADCRREHARITTGAVILAPAVATRPDNRAAPHAVPTKRSPPPTLTSRDVSPRVLVAGCPRGSQCP